MRSKIMMIALLLAVMIANAGITSASNCDGGNVLWVVPNNPSRYGLDETVIEDVIMGTSFSNKVLVLNQGSDNQGDAKNVNIYFVAEDISNIVNIDIGTAKRISTIPNPDVITDPNYGSNSAIGTLLAFNSPPDPNPGGPNGYWVSYLIGTIPPSGGPSQTGNPEDDLEAFDPYNGKYLIEVPFTIYFQNEPAPGFILNAYADNGVNGNCGAHTAYSHDGGFYQVPEFATIAIPIAAILGLVFFFQHRKRKEE